MCGLVGWNFTAQSTLKHEQRKTLILMGSMGADKRGGQSFGWLSVNAEGQFQIEKGLGPLVATNFDDLAKTPMGFAHSRFATKGAITVENSHPFRYDHIIGAHNGVISNSWELDRKYGDKNVDSEHIFERISKNDKLDELEGYGIIEFYDARFPHNLFLCNIGRGDLSLFELFDASGEFLDGYYWTSNEEDGELAIAAAGIKHFERSTLTIGKVYCLKLGDDQLYYKPDCELKTGERNYSTTSYHGGRHNHGGKSHYGYMGDEEGDYESWPGYSPSTSSSCSTGSKGATSTAKDAETDKTVESLLSEYPSLAEKMMGIEKAVEEAKEVKASDENEPSMSETHKMIQDLEAWKKFKKDNNLKFADEGDEDVAIDIVVEGDKDSCQLNPQVDLVESMNGSASDPVDFQLVREEANKKDDNHD